MQKNLIINFLRSYFCEGIKGGVCTLLEKKFGRSLLHLACRHHIYELILKCVVQVYWPTTNGPDMSVFKNFRERWDTIDKEKFEVGLDDPLISEILDGQKNEILCFISMRLEVLLLKS